MIRTIERTDGTATSSSPAALRLTYSADHGLLYLALGAGEVADTIEVEELVFVDIDVDGRPLGVEFLDATNLPAFLIRRGGEFIVPARVLDSDDLKGETATDSSE